MMPPAGMAGGGLKSLPDESAALPAMRQGDDKMQFDPFGSHFRHVGSPLAGGPHSRWPVREGRPYMSDSIDVARLPQLGRSKNASC